jgi:hypothetical protein
MASDQPSYGEDATPHRTMGRHGLQRVRGAGRIIAAHIAVQRTDHGAIGLEQADQDVLHRATPITRARHRSRSPARVALDAPPAGRNARITTRHETGSDGSRSRIRCRSCRRVRFRVTAPPTARPTIRPTRGDPSGAPADPARACTTRVEQPTRRPDRTTAVNSSLDRIRAAAGNTAEASAGLRRPGAGDPSAAGSTAPHGPLAYACADGNRASCADAGCWAETYACSLGTAPDRDRCAHGVAATTTRHPVQAPGDPGAGTTQSSNAVRLVDDTARSTLRSTEPRPPTGQPEPEPVDNRLYVAP